MGFSIQDLRRGLWSIAYLSFYSTLASKNNPRTPSSLRSWVPPHHSVLMLNSCPLPPPPLAEALTVYHRYLSVALNAEVPYACLKLERNIRRIMKLVHPVSKNPTSFTLPLAGCQPPIYTNPCYRSTLRNPTNCEGNLYCRTKSQIQTFANQIELSPM